MNFVKPLSVFLLIAFTFGACHINNTKRKLDTAYNYSQPKQVINLPVNLYEISGIAILDSSKVACIQDEEGFLYTYDLFRNEISEQITFTFDGDFEGITKVDSNLFVLRSDGNLFEISNLNSGNIIVKEYISSIPANEFEGLCFDKSNKRILVACKEEMPDSHKYRDKRLIFSFDMESNQFSDDPAIIIDMDSIKLFMSKNRVELPIIIKKNKIPGIPELKMQISDMCIHPITQKLYLLSASDYCLFIFSLEGRIEHVEILNPLLFNQAEGISFFENGDMAISNEGNGSEPSLLIFKYN